MFFAVGGEYRPTPLMGSLQRFPSQLAGCGRAALICVGKGREEDRARKEDMRRERGEKKGGEGSEWYEKEGKEKMKHAGTLASSVSQTGPWLRHPTMVLCI